MKSPIIKLFVGSLLIASISACDQSKPEESNERTESSFAEVTESDSLESYQIPNIDARSYIDKYQEYITSIEPEISSPEEAQFLTYGAKVDLAELARIVGRAQDPDSDSSQIFVMMGIMPSDTTEVIFCLNKYSEGNVTSSFFDFTRPCPTSCPIFQVERVE